MRVQGFEAGPDTNTTASFSLVGPDFFRTLGIPLLQGREFTARRRRRRAQGGRRQPGLRPQVQPRRPRRSAPGSAPAATATGLDIEIVGLVQDAKYSEVKDAIPPQIFRPYRQAASENVGSISFYVHDRRRRRGDARPGAGRGARARPEPAGREPQDHGPAGARERLPRPDDQHAVGRLRRAGDDPGGDRPLRRARLHGDPADPRVRAAHGARRRRRQRARHGARPRRADDRRRRRGRPGGGGRDRPAGPGAALRARGLRPGGARRQRDRCWRSSPPWPACCRRCAPRGSSRWWRCARTDRQRRPSLRAASRRERRTGCAGGAG